MSFFFLISLHGSLNPHYFSFVALDKIVLTILTTDIVLIFIY